MQEKFSRSKNTNIFDGIDGGRDFAAVRDDNGLRGTLGSIPTNSCSYESFSIIAVQTVSEKGEIKSCTQKVFLGARTAADLLASVTIDWSTANCTKDSGLS